MTTRQYSLTDQILIQFQQCLTTLGRNAATTRPNPAQHLKETTLTNKERRQSIQMMRVNHCGEVCAQALYYGQLLLARNQTTRQMLQQAAIEETDHLAWTEQRLNELKGHTSYFNLYWYCQSFFIGMLAASRGDAISLGFVEETEAQVTHHLESHLKRLSPADKKSRAILEQMRTDEQHHGQSANQAGAKPLPLPIQKLMQLQSKVMTTVAKYL